MEHRDEALSTRDLSRYADPQPAAVADQPAAAVAEPQTAAVAGPQTATAAEPQAEPASESEVDGQDGSLLPAQSGADFRGRWEGIQTRFVDDPRRAVEDADGLVATVMQELANGFAQERERLEAQWGRGEDISTEDLRVALQRYRSFFHRLLST